MTENADALSVARDILLERGSVSEVLDVARTMALERVALGLIVAWVERTSESEWHAYVAEEDRRKGCWLVKRLSRRPGYGAYDFDAATSPAEDVARRITQAAGLLDTTAWEPATPAVIETTTSIVQPVANCDGSREFYYDGDAEDGRGARLPKRCPGCRACS